MALLEIKKLGCPILRKPAAEVEVFCDDPGRQEELGQLIDDMFETMVAAEGIGLAAPQVGVGIQLAVLDMGPHDPSAEARVLINPTIVEDEGEITGEEGCLSLPGVTGDVKRSQEIRVQALGRDGLSQEFVFREIEARAAQHELDHLKGKLVIDRFSTIRRNLLRSTLRRLNREGLNQDVGITYMEHVARTGREAE